MMPDAPQPAQARTVLVGQALTSFWLGGALWWISAGLPILRHNSWLLRELLLARVAPLVGPPGARCLGGGLGEFLGGALILVLLSLPGGVVLTLLRQRAIRILPWWLAHTLMAMALLHGGLWLRSASAFAFLPPFRPILGLVLLVFGVCCGALGWFLGAGLPRAWVGERKESWILPAAGLTILLGLVPLVLSRRGGGSAPAPGEWVVAQPPRPLVLFALDGVGWGWIDRLPGEQSLIGSWHAAPLASIFPPLSPPVWTSVATGKRPWQHGIEGFVFDGDAAVPAHAGYRRARPFWDVAGKAGLRCLIVNWYVTWPAAAPAGSVLVSDRFLHDSLDQRVAPQAQAAVVDSLVASHRPRVDSLLVAVAGPEPDPLAAPVANAAWRHLRRELERDYLATRVLLYYLPRGPWDLVALYLRGSDGAQHRYWREHIAAHGDPAARWAYALTGARGNSGAYGDLLVDYYQLLDDWLREIVAKTAAEARFLAISDHGVGVRLGDPGRAQLDPLFERMGLLARRRGGEVDRQASRLWDETPSGRRNARNRRVGVGESCSMSQAAKTLEALQTSAGLPVFSRCEIAAAVLEVEISRGLPGGSAVDLPGGGSIPLKQFAAVAIEGDFSGAHRMDGVLFSSETAGRLFARGYSVLDIAPTVLELCGLPAALDMEGEVIPALLEQDPRPKVRSWEDGERIISVDNTRAVDEEIRRELRALGYIE